MSLVLYRYQLFISIIFLVFFLFPQSSSMVYIFKHFFKNVTLSKKNDKKKLDKCEDFCCICCETMTERDKFRCGHEFCTECIETLLYYNGIGATCPLCRMPVYDDINKENRVIQINRKKWTIGTIMLIYFIGFSSFIFFRYCNECNS